MVMVVIEEVEPCFHSWLINTNKKVIGTLLSDNITIR